MTTPVTTDRRRWRRPTTRRGWLGLFAAALAAVLLVILLVGLLTPGAHGFSLSLGSHSLIGAGAAVGDESGGDSGGGAAGNASCGRKSVPHGFAAVQLHQPGGSDEAEAMLKAMKDKADVVIYSGDLSADVGDWLTEACSYGIPAVVQVDGPDAPTGIAGVNTRAAAAAKHLNYIATMLSVNYAQSHHVLNQRIAAVKKAAPHAEVWVVVNAFEDNSDITGASRLIVTLLNYNTMKDHPLSDQRKAGQQSKRLSGARATVGIQAFNWADDPETAKAIGVTATGLPNAEAVRSMVSDAMDGGAVNVALLTLESSGDDAKYVGGVALAAHQQTAG